MRQDPPVYYQVTTPLGLYLPTTGTIVPAQPSAREPAQLAVPVIAPQPDPQTAQQKDWSKSKWAVIAPFLSAVTAAVLTLAGVVIAHNDKQEATKPAVVDCSVQRTGALAIHKDFPKYRLPKTDPAQATCDINGFLDAVG